MLHFSTLSPAYIVSFMSLLALKSTILELACYAHFEAICCASRLKAWNKLWRVWQGEMLHPKLVVPRLKVYKDWYEGLATDFIKHDEPDVGGNTDAEVAAVLAEQQQVGFS